MRIRPSTRSPISMSRFHERVRADRSVSIPPSQVVFIVTQKRSTADNGLRYPIFLR
jgi:hypothetical protein